MVLNSEGSNSMPSQRSAVVVDAPSNLGLSPPSPDRIPGCWRLPQALRSEGLVARLEAADGGRVEPPAYTPDRDATGTRNGLAIAGYSVRLADRVGELLDAGGFPVVLGGDCSILLGPMLALRRRGRYGLAYLDGHLDFRHPGNSTQLSAAAGEDLAVVTGRGPEQLAGLEGRRPLVRDADVVALGHHDPDPAWYQDVTASTEITLIGADQIRGGGAAEAAAKALAILEGRSLDGFWIHVDVDVLDRQVMPAVDSPEPDGLDYRELVTLLRALTASDLAVGAEVTIFDPDLDGDGHLARELATAVVESFAPAQRRA
jgi:arginase